MVQVMPLVLKFSTFTNTSQASSPPLPAVFSLGLQTHILMGVVGGRQGWRWRARAETSDEPEDELISPTFLATRPTTWRGAP